MKKFLLLTCLSFLLVALGHAQITSIGIIGTATAGGWDSDTDLVQDTADADIWTATLELFVGEAKFRADDDWAMNWGNIDFPIGIGTQDGPNILVPIAGTYDITFNSSTGWYFLNLSTPIGIIGSATPFGWDSDVNLLPDTADTNLFGVTIDLAAGEAKFRANDDWVINWGADSFPSGTGVQDGPNIPIPKSGNYTISFDSSTGAYLFVENISFFNVGIIGDGTPNGWDSVTTMIQSESDPDVWMLSTPVPGGGLQFTANDGEFVWGSSGFPTDTAMLNGDTLMVPAGSWVIEFNTETLIYTFTEIRSFGSIGIIGDATPGGWDVDTDMERDAVDSSLWSLRTILTTGEAKFRADDDWAVNWGAGDFPSGIGIQDGANIPIEAGEYIITFNSVTGAYDFKELIIYNSIGLIGTATEFGDWDNDVFMTKTQEDENLWILPSVTLVDGEAKFRVDTAWTVNWGAEDFPTGKGTQDGPNILIVGGKYGVTLNSGTGEYAFGDEITTNIDVLNPSSIKAYPNPTTGLLNLDLSAAQIQGKVNLTIYNMNGQLMKTVEKNAHGVIQLDVSNLPRGAYSLQIRNQKYLIGKRFILTH